MSEFDFMKMLEEDVSVSNIWSDDNDKIIENVKNNKRYIYEEVLDDIDGELSQNQPEEQQVVQQPEQPQIVQPVPVAQPAAPAPQMVDPATQQQQQVAQPQPDFTGGLNTEAQPQQVATQEEVPAEQPAAIDPNTGQPTEQPAQDEQQIDPNTGMPVEPEPDEEGMGVSDTSDADHSYKPETLGHLFKAKKIYQIMVTVKKSLEDLTDKRYVSIKDSCEEGLDIFKNIISNFNKFSNKMPEILKLYKKFSILLVARLHEISEEIAAEQKDEQGD